MLVEHRIENLALNYARVFIVIVAVCHPRRDADCLPSHKHHQLNCMSGADNQQAACGPGLDHTPARTDQQRWFNRYDCRVVTGCRVSIPVSDFVSKMAIGTYRRRVVYGKSTFRQ